MMYVTGDIHGDPHRFSMEIFPEQREMTREDFVIVLGDFGLVWSNKPTKEEKYWLDWLDKKSFTTLFIDGNHDNHHILNNTFEEVDFHGGRAHRIRDNVYHLMRGYVFDICDRKIFAFGGASSHDIKDGILDPGEFSDEAEFRKVYNRWRKENRMFRVRGVSWWDEEIPSEEEMQRGRENLEKCNYEVDFVISHCCPTQVASVFSHGIYKPDLLTDYFDRLLDKISFSRWFFGHYHGDQQIMGKFIMLYEQIIRIA
jgi:hypothetical protein